MLYFTERTPGTYIESKESSLAWHYKDADPHFGTWQAKDMQISMEDVLSNLPLEIIQGNHIVEVRHRAVSKARVLEKVMEHLRSAESVAQHGGHAVDFIFCAGDGQADEDMFQFLSRWKENHEAELAAKHGAELLAYQAAQEQELAAAAATSAASAASAAPAAAAAAGASATATAAAALAVGAVPMPSPPAGVSPGVPPGATSPVAPRRVIGPSMFNVMIGNTKSEANWFVDNTMELRRVLRAFASVSRKDHDLRVLEEKSGPKSATKRESLLFK